MVLTVTYKVWGSFDLASGMSGKFGDPYCKKSSFIFRFRTKSRTKLDLGDLSSKGLVLPAVLRRFCAEILARSSIIESLHRDLAAETSCRYLVSTESSYRDLVQTSCLKVSYRDFMICCQETSYGELVQRSLKQILPRDLL